VIGETRLPLFNQEELNFGLRREELSKPKSGKKKEIELTGYIIEYELMLFSNIND